MARVLRVRTVPVFCLATGILVAEGCGASDRPSVFGDVVPHGGAASDSGTPGLLDLDSAPYVPQCSLGPEGGVCACADQPLLVDTPTLYFVLDRSGSMNESHKWDNVRVALHTLVVSLGPRAGIGAAVFPYPFPQPVAPPATCPAPTFPRRSGDGCTPGIEVFAPRRGDAPAGTPGATTAALDAILCGIPAAGGTPTAATLTALLPRLTSLPGKTYVILATDGGPNCNAAAVCAAAKCTSNLDSAPGCPPGGPPNCCDATHAGASGCLDEEPTLSAVRAIAAAGIKVYVVGVPGSAPYASMLDQLAQAGGTARAVASPGEHLYYAIDSADQAALGAVLGSIAAQITGSCTLDLGQVPPEPSLVNVFFDERPLPQAGPDGWTLDGTVVTVEGASCQKILTGGVLDVRVVAGCPTVTF